MGCGLMTHPPLFFSLLFLSANLLASVLSKAEARVHPEDSAIVIRFETPVNEARGIHVPERSLHGSEHPPMAIRLLSNPLVDRGMRCQRHLESHDLHCTKEMELKFYVTGAVPLFSYKVVVHEIVSGVSVSVPFWIDSASSSEEVVAIVPLADDRRAGLRFLIEVLDLFPGLTADEACVVRKEATLAPAFEGGTWTSPSLSGHNTLRVAVCFAGAWRRWNESWSTIQPNLVDALGADVFAVSDDDPGGINARDSHHTNANFTVGVMRTYFGSRLKGAHHYTAAELRNLSQLTFAEIAGAQKAGA